MDDEELARGLFVGGLFFLFIVPPLGIVFIVMAFWKAKESGMWRED